MPLRVQAGGFVLCFHMPTYYVVSSWLWWRFMACDCHVSLRSRGCDAAVDGMHLTWHAGLIDIH